MTKLYKTMEQSAETGIWKTYLSIALSLEELVEKIIQDFDHATLVDFIKRLDERAQDWGVTYPLCLHFERLKEEYEQEQRELQGEDPCKK